MNEVNDIEVDRIAIFAAHSGYQLEMAHPKGYIWASPAHRMWRALYAYEWAKAHKAEWESPNMPGYYELPNPNAVRQAIYEREMQDDDKGGDDE